MGINTVSKTKTMTKVILFMSNYMSNLVCNYYFILKVKR